MIGKGKPAGKPGQIYLENRDRFRKTGTDLFKTGTDLFHHN
jgi:hypothetical protein